MSNQFSNMADKRERVTDKERPWFITELLYLVERGTKREHSLGGQGRIVTAFKHFLPVT